MRFGFVGRISCLAVFGLGFIGAAAAQSAGDAGPGDAAAGKKKFYTCYGCHSIDSYRNAYPNYSVPELRHQHAAYVVAALHEYKNSDRPHPTMHAQAYSLSDQDIQDIAAYLQGGDGVKPTTAVVGKTPAQAQTCVSCHGVNGTGVDAPLDPKPPVLAGQHADYLEQALTAYRNGRRKNAVMDSMAQTLASPADVKLMAEYFAAQSPALTVPKPRDP